MKKYFGSNGLIVCHPTFLWKVMFRSDLDDWEVVVQATFFHMQKFDVGLYQVCTEAGLKFDALTTSLFSRMVLVQLQTRTSEGPPEWVINTCQRMMRGEDVNRSTPLAPLTRKMAIYLVEGHPDEN